jgi:transposase-like protein
MTCPHCGATATTKRPDRTALGYRCFRCRRCNCGFNERTGTPFNHLQYPTDVICLVVLWRFRYKLSLQDLAEMFLQRSIVFTHEAVRAWGEETGTAPHRRVTPEAQGCCGKQLVRRRDIHQRASRVALSLPCD